MLNVSLNSKFWSAILGGTVIRDLMQTESSGKGVSRDGPDEFGLRPDLWIPRRLRMRENCFDCWLIWEGPTHCREWHSWEVCTGLWKKAIWTQTRENNSVSSRPPWFQLQFLCGFLPWLPSLMNPRSVGWNERFPPLGYCWLIFIPAGTQTGVSGKLNHQFSTVVTQHLMRSVLISNLSCEYLPCEISTLDISFWSLEALSEVCPIIEKKCSLGLPWIASPS